MASDTRLPTGGPTSHYFISQRLRLHYADWGNEGAPPLILVHGGRDHCRNWDWVAQELRKDWHVICPDLAGHGDSGWNSAGNYRVTYFTYDLVQLIRHLGYDRVTIIGHSLGGGIALRYASLFPEKVRRMIAIEGIGVGYLSKEDQKIADRLRQWMTDKQKAADREHIRYPDFGAALARMKAQNAHLADWQAEHLTTHAVVQNEDGSYSWKFDPHLRVQSNIDLFDPDLIALYDEISCPVLHCYGEDSWARNPEKDGRIDYFRNARVASFPDAGHWLHHDRFDLFVERAKAFLSEDD